MSRRRSPHPYHVTVVRYLDADGRRCAKGAPGARRVVERTDSYYADLPGAPRTPLGTTDEALAWAELRRLLKQAHDEALGIRDEYSDHASRPLAEHLADWVEVLAAKGTGAKQRGQVKARLTRLFGLAGWTRLTEVTADSAQIALARAQQAGGRGGKPGRSARTRNHYLAHLKSFCGWLVDSGRARGNPVRQLRGVAVEADRRHQRRCPTSAEVAELARHLLSPEAPDRKGMTARQRLLGYSTAMATGFRAGELRSLGRESFDLDAGTVTLSAGVDKRRRQVVQRLPPWLVEDLRAWFACDLSRQAAGGGCWGAFPALCPGRVLRQDLDATRAAWVEAAADPTDREWRERSPFLRYQVEGPDGPQFWDMHSLRVWYISQLAADPSITLKTLMELARHASPQLSLAVYAKARPEDLQRAVDRLPPPAPPAE